MLFFYFQNNDGHHQPLLFYFQKIIPLLYQKYGKIITKIIFYKRYAYNYYQYFDYNKNRYFYIIAPTVVVPINK